jgi:uncharacterized protein
LRKRFSTWDFALRRLLKKTFSLPLADARGSVTALESSPVFPSRNCKGAVRSLLQPVSRLLLLVTLTALAFAAEGSLKDAIAAGDLPRVQALLDSGAGINGYDDLGRTPLHEAVWAGHPEMVRLLITRGADVSAHHSDGGSTPLDYAAVRGDSEIAALLIRAGAKPGPTALNLAAARDDKELTQLFIDAGAPVTSDAFNEALRHRSLTVLALLLKKDASRATELLDEPLRKNDAALVKVLAEHGADVNHPNRFGATPLHDAAARGDAALVRVLLDCGARVNAIEPDTGATPLYESVALGRTDVVTVLLERGADPNIREKNGHGALHAASANGFSSIADLLRKHGALEDSALPPKTPAVR